MGFLVLARVSKAILGSQSRFEELTNLIRTIRNAMKIRDVTKCLEEFELLGKAYGKAKSIVDKEGVPRFYIRILADLEDYLNEVWLLAVRGRAGGIAGLGPVPNPLPGLLSPLGVSCVYGTSWNMRKRGMKQGGGPFWPRILILFSFMLFICGFLHLVVMPKGSFILKR